MIFIIHALEADVPEACKAFINDASMKGPPSDYNGSEYWHDLLLQE